MNSLLNGIKIVKNLQTTLQTSPTGVSFVGVTGYTNSKGEVSNVLLNVGASLANAKAKDIETLQGLKVSSLETDFETDLLEQARLALIASLKKPSKARSEGQKDAYTHLGNGLKVHNETNEIYIFGLVYSKTVIKKGEYKKVNSRPLTLAKNYLRKKFMRSTKYRQYKLTQVEGFKLNGQTLALQTK